MFGRNNSVILPEQTHASGGERPRQRRPMIGQERQTEYADLHPEMWTAERDECVN